MLILSFVFSSIWHLVVGIATIIAQFHSNSFYMYVFQKSSIIVDFHVDIQKAFCASYSSPHLSLYPVVLSLTHLILVLRYPLPICNIVFYFSFLEIFIWYSQWNKYMYSIMMSSKIRENLRCFSLRVCVLSLRMFVSSSIHLLVNFVILFFLIAQWYSSI